MSDITSWQVEAEAAEYYEANLVPALMTPWAVATATAAGIRPGDRVLDVACGTGVATRAASALAGPGARVVGFDLNQGMLAVARRVRGDLEWRQGDAAAMPFADGEFDRVLCQFGLMFMPDRAAALAEMRRVLAPGGGLGLTVWGPIETSPPYARQAEIVERLVGNAAAAIVRAPFVLSDPGPLVAMVEAAGFDSVQLETRLGEVVYPSIDGFLAGEVDATPLAAAIRATAPDREDQVRAEIREAVRPFDRDDMVRFPCDAHLISARVTAP